MTITNNNLSNRDSKVNEKYTVLEWQQLLRDLTLIGESYPDDFSLAEHRKNAWNQ